MAADIFAKIGDIKGESLDSKHKDEIEVLCAITAYERAIELDPNHANAYSNLGVLLRATGKPSESEAACRTAIRLNPVYFGDLRAAVAALATALRPNGMFVCTLESGQSCGWAGCSINQKSRVE